IVQRCVKDDERITIDRLRKNVVSFFIQAEDGILDRNVTGVQTCALPISPDAAVFQTARDALSEDFQPMSDVRGSAHYRQLSAANLLERLRLVLLNDTQASLETEQPRSEERRVGKERRARQQAEPKKTTGQ